METGMRVLLALAFGVTALLGTAASATVYVPGQYKDGIYTRPHFLDYTGQTDGGPLLLPPDQEAAKAKEALGAGGLDRGHLIPKPRPLPTS
jgi:hypothetical protein